MSLFSKRLMKWREPKIKGMVTSKNILTAIGLILIVAIPFGFLSGNRKFSVSIYLLALAFMSVAVIGLALQSLLPGTLVQLKEDMIVRGARGTNSQRSAYKDIDCINFYRDCSYSWNQNRLVVNVHQRKVEGPNFISFLVVMKKESLRSVQTFAVPEDVKLEQVFQILRDRGVKVVELTLPA
ncbi:MAG TPA: hypothetical protein VG077_15265 [Verrucomicrobiae bacterium]|nr:hypothetical protein [Verrucomicrobiae bacterium]